MSLGSIFLVVGFRMLSFLDAYSGCDQIRMNPADAPKIDFMTDWSNYYYEVILFVLKNVGATYQRLMDMVFASQIRRNIEVIYLCKTIRHEGYE